MSKYIVVIKNRFADEQTVARIRTFDDEKQELAKESADTLCGIIKDWIDNDIYFADVEEEEIDEN